MQKLIHAMMLAALLSACGTSGQGLHVKELPAETLHEQRIDTGLGGKGSVRLGFRYAPAGFKTQLLGCKINTHLQSFRVFLIDGSSSFGILAPLGILGNLSAKALPSSSSWFAINKSGLSSPSDTQTVTLSNVGSGKYYIAVAAYDGPDGTGNNITAAVSALLSGGSITGTGSVLVSDGGGEPGNPGRVHVGAAPDYQILSGSAAPLQVKLQLGALCL